MLRATVSLWKLTFQAAPRESLWGLLTIPIGMATPVLITFLIGLLTDAAVAHDVDSLIQLALLFALVITIMYLVQGLNTRMRLTMTEKSRLVLHAMTMKQVSSVRSLELHEASEASDRLELLRQGQEAIANGPSEMFVTIGYVIQLGLTVGLLAAVHPALLLLPVLGLVPTIAVWVSEKHLRDSEVRSAPFLRQARQILLTGTSSTGLSETLLYNAANRLEQIYFKAIRSAGGIVDRTQARVTSLQVISWLVFAVGFIGATVLTINLALMGRVSEGQVVLVILLSATVSSHVTNISFAARNIGSIIRKVSHFQWLQEFAAQAESKERRKLPPSLLGSSIRFENVWFKYPGSQRWTLRNLTFTLPAGTLSAIVGRNGSGKTTIIKLLLGFYAPTRGQIYIDGTDLEKINLEAWHKRCTAVFQDLTRFEMRLGESVALGDLTRLDAQQDQIVALEAAGAGSLVQELGVDAQLGKRWGGVNLSGGQWQMIALARALYRTDPLVSIFDEATASLDPSSERNIYVEYADKWRKNNKVGGVAVFITHRFPSINFADRILVIDQGAVAEQGTHDQLIKRGGIYAELYEIQTELFDFTG